MTLFLLERFITCDDYQKQKRIGCRQNAYMKNVSVEHLGLHLPAELPCANFRRRLFRDEGGDI